MLAIRRAPADHDTQACFLGLTLCTIVVGHFNHGWYIVAIPDLGVVCDLRAWHRCDQEQLWWLYINSGSQKKRFYETLNFDLVKVRNLPFFILLPGLKPGAKFVFSYIAFVVYIYRTIFGLFLLRLIIFIDKTSDDSAVKLRTETLSSK